MCSHSSWVHGSHTQSSAASALSTVVDIPSSPAVLTRSAVVHPEYQEAEEHSDPHEGDGRRRREKLPVVDAEVPHHSQDDHEHGDHQAAGADGHPRGPEPPRRVGAGLGRVLCRRLLQALGDVAVDDAVVRDVER